MRRFRECCLEVGGEDDTFNVFTRAVIFLQSTVEGRNVCVVVCGHF